MLSKNIKIYLCMCMCISMCYVHDSVLRGEKSAFDLLEIELQEEVSYQIGVLGTKFRFLGRTANTLNH